LRSKNKDDHDRLDKRAHHQHQSVLGMLDGVGGKPLVKAAGQFAVRRTFYRTFNISASDVLLTPC